MSLGDAVSTVWPFPRLTRGLQGNVPYSFSNAPFLLIQSSKRSIVITLVQGTCNLSKYIQDYRKAKQGRIFYLQNTADRATDTHDSDSTLQPRASARKDRAVLVLTGSLVLAAPP